MKNYSIELSGKSYPVAYLHTIYDMEKFIESDLDDSFMWGLDIETSSLEPLKGFIRTIQLYNPEEEVVVVLDVGINAGMGYIEAVCEKIKDLPCIAHNAMFEYKWLWQAFPHKYNLMCSMIMYQMAIQAVEDDPFNQPGNKFGSSLANVYKLMVDEDWQMKKSTRGSDWGNIEKELTDEQIEYAAIDAVATVKIAEVCIKGIEKYGMTELYKLNMEAMYPVTKMNRAGFFIDKAKHEKMCEGWETKMLHFYDKVEKQLGEDVNVNSGKQISEWLEKNIGAKELEERGWGKSEKTDVYLTDHRTLVTCGHGINWVENLLEYKSYKKLYSTYGKKMRNEYLVPSSGCIHADYTLGFTATGRMSSRSPNIQNQPRTQGLREIYIPKLSFRLAVADYGQIELRIAAHLSKDPNMLEVYSQGNDLHSSTTNAVFGIFKDKVEPSVWKEWRVKAKAVNFGLLYGSGVAGLIRYAKGMGIELTEKEAQEFVDGFRAAYPGYRDWQLMVSNLMSEDGKNKYEMTYEEMNEASYVRTTRGKHIKVNPRQYYTTSMNYPIQGTAAELMLDALIKVNRLLETRIEDNQHGKHARLVACVHDEIIAEYRENIGIDEIVKGCIQEGMEQAMLELIPEATLLNLVEVGTGYSWQDAK